MERWPVSHRSFGFHSADALIALVYLCCTGVVIDPAAMNFTHKPNRSLVIAP